MSKPEFKTEGTLMTWAKKPQVIVAIGSFFLILFFFDYFTADYKIPGVRNLAALFANAAPTIEYSGFLLGTVVYAEHNVKNALKKTKEGLVGLIGLAIIIAYVGGFIFGGYSSPVYQFLEISFRAVTARAGTVLTTFILIAASYRTLKFRSLTAVFAIAATIIAILYQIPIGPVISPSLVPFGQWINSYIVSAVSSAFTILGAIGSVVLTIRIILGWEWGMYGLPRRRRK